MSGEFSGKVALVTGASSGIGAATARLLAERGASLALVGRDRARLEETAAAAATPAAVIVADLARTAEREKVVPACLERFGRLDVLVNNAGVIAGGSLEATGPERWEAMLEINLRAVVDLMRAALPHLVASHGCVVNVSSVAGLRAFPNLLAYCVSKAALDQLTRCTALELGPKGVRVNGVNPGVVVTELHRRGGMDEAAYAAFLEHSKDTHPLGRVGQPEEVAEAITYLASPRAAFLTGVTLPVDGGRSQTCFR